MTAAVLHIECGSVALQILLTQQITGAEWTSLLREFGQRYSIESLARGDHRDAIEEHLGPLGYAGHDRV